MNDVNDLPFPEKEGGYNIGLFVEKQETYSKESLKLQAKKEMNAVIEGIVEPAEVYAKLKAISHFIDECINEIKEDVITEVDKYGKEGVNVCGIPLIVKNQGKKYSFEDNDDWIELDDKIKDLTDKRKDIESKMKALVGTAGYVDSDSGEMLAPARIVSEGKTIVQATIPKK